MKKAFYLLIAAATLMTVASCVKDQFESIRSESSVGQTEFTVSLAPGTRTDLNEEGKTVWAEGDTLWVTNGVGVDKIGVSEEAWGTQEFSIKTDKATPTVDNPTVYIVYPYDSGSKITEDGKVVVKVPGVQDGNFASANICAGVSEGQSVALRNVTAVMKVTVPAETPAPIYQLVFTAAGEGAALSGDVAVDFSGENPVITAENTSASVVTNVGGVDGAIYTAVIPGKYEAGFKLTAATIDFEHATQTKVTTAANDVKINEIVDLGSIGTDLQPLGGDGSKGNPFQIENLAHLIALSAAIDNNYEDIKGFEGQYFKVMNDISGVTTPIGTGEYPFCGDFDGNNQSITVDISGNADGMGLFAYISNGANIHDLVVEGSVTSSGDFIGGVIGYSVCDKDGARATVKNVVNTAKVTGNNDVGGIAGYSNYTDYDGCVNTGKVTGIDNVGGIVGYLYFSVIANSENDGAIVSNAKNTTSKPYSRTYAADAWAAESSFVKNYNIGTGGITGWTQNSTVKYCVNKGSVDGLVKIGGVIGSSYWTSAVGNTNSGIVTAAGDNNYNVSSQMGFCFGSMAGGIIGWLMTGYDVSDCINKGDIYGKGGIGGIVGIVQNEAGRNNINIKNCQNSGNITATNVYTGGGLEWHNPATGGIVGTMLGSQEKYTTISDCINKGDVFSDFRNVGGIVGSVSRLSNYLAYNRIGYPAIKQCINEGDVTGLLWVGGIVGLSQARVMTQTNISNCENHGTITGNRPDDYGEYAGGIIGANGTYNSSYKTNTNLHLRIRNCYNDGEVLYEKATHASPYAGGIVGYINASAEIANVYNIGYVGPANHSAPVANAYKYLGCLAGCQYADVIKFSYASTSVLNGQRAGTGGAASLANTVSTFDENGGLASVVVVNSQDCTQLLNALNEWQNYYVGAGNVYYNWTEPANHPVFDYTMN